jgi:hypothetical protein
VDIKLRVMASPPGRGRTVMVTTSRRFMNGKGPDSLACGQCRHRLISGFDRSKDDLTGMIFKCPKCGALNDTDGLGHP